MLIIIFGEIFFCCAESLEIEAEIRHFILSHSFEFYVTTNS